LDTMGGSNPGEFDFYLLAQSWAAHFCCLKPERCATVEEAWSSSKLMLHGLWPAYFNKREDGRYPADCAVEAKFDKVVIPPLALKLAPNYHGGLARHEWNKHGTCSGMPPKLYFEEALRTMLAIPKTSQGTPEVISSHIGSEVESGDVRRAYVREVGIKVSDKCVLEEITTCWDKGEKKYGVEKVGQQIDCPDYIMRGFRNNCDSGKCKGKIRIPKIGQCEI